MKITLVRDMSYIVTDSIRAANGFVRLAMGPDAAPVTRMKLQKLIYIAQGWALALTGKNLVQETFEASSYGPLLRSVHEAFRPCGMSPISMLAKTRVPGKGDVQRTVFFKESRQKAALIQRVWEVYGKCDGAELTGMIEMDGSPWLDAVETDPGNGSLPRIPNAWIKRYFRKFVCASSLGDLEAFNDALKQVRLLDKDEAKRAAGAAEPSDSSGEFSLEGDDGQKDSTSGDCYSQVEGNRNGESAPEEVRSAIPRASKKNIVLDLDDLKALADEDLRKAALSADWLKDSSQNRKERKKFAGRVFLLLSLWLGFVSSAIICARLGHWLPLSDNILLALIGSASVDLVGLMAIVLRYLFSQTTTVNGRKEG